MGPADKELISRFVYLFSINTEMNSRVRKISGNFKKILEVD
jgi:hypothetical protein